MVMGRFGMAHERLQLHLSVHPDRPISHSHSSHSLKQSEALRLSLSPPLPSRRSQLGFHPPLPPDRALCRRPPLPTSYSSRSAPPDPVSQPPGSTSPPPVSPRSSSPKGLRRAGGRPCCPSGGSALAASAEAHGTTEAGGTSPLPRTIPVAAASGVNDSVTTCPEARRGGGDKLPPSAPLRVAAVPAPASGRMHEDDSSAAVSVTAYPEACDNSWEKLASALPPSPAVGLPSSAPPPSSKVAGPSPAQPATGRMLEENNGVVSVTVYTEECHDKGNKSSSVIAPAPPAPVRMLEDYHGVVYVTAYPEVCHGSRPESSLVLAPAPSFAVEPLSLAPAPSSAVAVPAPGQMVEEKNSVLSVNSGNKSSLAPAPSYAVAVPAPVLAHMPWENNGAVSVAAYSEVFHDSGNKSSLAPAPSSTEAIPSQALAPGRMLEENNGVFSVTAYPQAGHCTEKSSLVPAPLSAVGVLSPTSAPGRVLEENNGVVSVTAYPQAGHGTEKKSSPPSFVVAPAPASDQMPENRNNGVVSVSSYLQAGHGIGKKKLSSPSSLAALAPTLDRTLEEYAKEWAERKAASGAPQHQCVLPFLSGAPKAVECRVCYKIVHNKEEIKCSVSRCEQTFHLSCVVEDTANFIAESFKCPQHGCMVCKQKMFFWRCGRCTVAAHTKCAPWPLIHLKDDQGSAICWRHPSNWLLQNENADLTNNIEEAFCRLPLPYVNEEFNIDSTIRDFSAIVCKPPSYTHIRRNVYLVKKKRADSSAETGCRNCRADSVCRDDCECRGLSMSCSKNCRCSDLCSNKPFRKDKKFKIVKSEGCGWGAVALEPLEKGDFIIEYVGEVINDITCEQRLWEMKRRGDKNFYMCEISKDCTIDATFKGNTSRFLNHSCDPNCKLEKWQVEGETRVGVFASRSIEVGEPLTYDYRFVHFGEKVKCNCGAKSCQGYLGVQLKNPTQDALAAAALENQSDCSPSRLKPETHLLPWTNCIDVPFNLRSKGRIDRLCWGRKRQRTSIIDSSTSSVTEATTSVP